MALLRVSNKWLRDPAVKRAVMVRAIMSAQLQEGIAITTEQAEHAYDTVQAEKKKKNNPKRA